MILEPEDEFYITGRGKAFSFTKEQIPAYMRTPANLRDRVVTINGKDWYVTGVEMFVIGVGREDYTGPFALLVREPIDEDY